jgi:quercetin dioxygenase-like cupin family protein
LAQQAPAVTDAARNASLSGLPECQEERMPSIERPLAGGLRIYDLGEERRNAAAGPASAGRRARSLVKDGPLRVTVVQVEAGGRIAEHAAPGPITVQPLDGRIRFTAEDGTHDLGPGQLLALGPGIRHSVSSDEGGAFLLTHGHPGG